jgi:hypothetical protein
MYFSHFIRDRQIAAYSWATSAIANPQISWKCQSANRNSASFMINPQICKLLQNTAQLCLKTVLKVAFLKLFCVQI